MLGVRRKFSKNKPNTTHQNRRNGGNYETVHHVGHTPCDTSA